MTAAATGMGHPLELQRFKKVIVVVDVVESVRLMLEHEDDVIDRWRNFSAEVRGQLLPRFEGRIVKSLGDGLLIDFDNAVSAAAAAIAIQNAIAPYNAGRAPDACIQLRIGAHVSDVVIGEDDIFGVGVNLAARLAAMAGPSEIVVSAELRDELVPGLDAQVEDLGECFLKHIDTPIRVFRVGAVGEQPVLRPLNEGAAATDLRAVVAVIPFDHQTYPGSEQVESLGDLIADGVIALLSSNPNFRVVSRMSSKAFRGRSSELDEMARHLGASYVLSGSYSAAGGNLRVTAEIADVRRKRVVWADRMTVRIDDLLAAESELLTSLVTSLNREILYAEFSAARLQPPPTLESYSLQIGGISLMHRSSGRDFDHVKAIFEHLIERHPRLAAPRAWLAKWYVLRVTRGLVPDPTQDAAVAIDHTRRAMQADPSCSLALAMQGFVKCHMLRDLDGAMTTFDSAIGMNPSDSLAWLFKGVVHSLWGEGASALSATTEARRLSPLDPLGHYYDALVAPAALAAGEWMLAVQLAERSLRINRSHAPAWRALAIAQAELGRVEAARESVRQLAGAHAWVHRELVPHAFASGRE